MSKSVDDTDFLRQWKSGDVLMESIHMQKVRQIHRGCIREERRDRLHRVLESEEERSHLDGEYTCRRPDRYTGAVSEKKGETESW